MKSVVFRLAFTFFAVFEASAWQSLQAQAPAPQPDLGAEESRRRDERLARLERQRAASRVLSPVDELVAKINKKMPWMYGQPRLPAHKSFEGFVLDDEKLERELWEAIKANALIARRIVPLRRELEDANERIKALPPIDISKPFTTGVKRGPEIEGAFLHSKLLEAYAAEKAVGSLIYSLNVRRDVRCMRLYACLLWEPGENTTISGDAGHSCLRETALGQIGDLITDGVLDMDKWPRNETEWREWWLNNVWKWGWSYEIEPITDTHVFPTPTESGFKPEPPAPQPTPTPPPSPSPKAIPALPDPATTQPGLKDYITLLFSILGAIALLLASLFYLRRRPRKKVD